MVSPEDIMKMIKSGKMRRPSNVPPGANSMGPMAMQADPVNMSPEEYRMRSCMTEVNAALKKYNCRLIPQIHLDTVNGVRGMCAIDILPPQEQTLPIPSQSPLANGDAFQKAHDEEEAHNIKADEEAAKARLEALRAETLKAEETAVVPNEEA